MTDDVVDPIRAVAAARDPERFVRTFHLTREDDSLGLMDPTAHQMLVLRALMEHRFVLVVKYRQAYISTIALAWLLGQVEYTPGLHGVFMAERGGSAEDTFRRAFNAYMAQPRWMRVPATRAGLHGIEFVHKGRLQVMTAGAGQAAPALGQSVSRAVFTEFGFWRNQRKVIGNLFPAFLKRPHARIIGESTPGPFGCGYHELVMANWQVPNVDEAAEQAVFDANPLAAPDTRRYHVVFLPWWHDATCVARGDHGIIDASGLVIEQSEYALMEAMPGITRGHLLFRRQLLESEFGGDHRLFESKYPRDVYSGWYSSKTPAFPEEDLRAMLPDSVTDCAMDGAWEAPEDGEKYWIFVDPNSYGRSGDPSAHSVFRVGQRREVAAWSGRIDPVAYAHVLARLGRWFNNATIVVESNAAACITALMGTGYVGVWCADDNRDHPGWYRTANAKDRAHGAFVQLLRAKDASRLHLASREGIQQCLAYDGTGAHGRSSEGAEHHYDRVAVYLMAADLLAKMPVPVLVRPLVDYATSSLSVKGFKALAASRARKQGTQI